MTNQTNAELISAAEAFIGTGEPHEDLIVSLAERLEAADRRAAELAAVVEKVREEAEAYAKQPEVMEPCGAVAQSLQWALAAAPADVLRELKADVWDEGYGPDESCGMPRTNPYRSES